VSNVRNGIEVMRRYPLDKKRIPYPRGIDNNLR
jgi:hypothetical protein